MSRGVAALLLAALWTSGCAGPTVKRASLEGWQTVETKGVRIFGDVGPEELDALAQDLSGFHAAFSFLIGREITSSAPTTIAVIRDPVLGGRIGLGRGIGGFAWQTFDGAFACVQGNRTRSETRITLFHEYTHILLWRHRSALIARWYTEGLADYFSTVSFRDGALVVGALPATRLNWLAARRRPMALDLLFGGARDETVRGREIYDFYSISWALTHYLLSTPKGRGELSRFERELAKGTPLDAAREAAFGRPFERLTEELTRHVGYLARGVAAESVLDPRKVRVTQPSPAVPMSAGEMAGAVGSLTLTLADDSEGEDDFQDYHGRVTSLARSYLEIAAEDATSDARLRAALARARAYDGDLKGAQTLVAGALRDASTDATVQVDAGRVALMANSFGEAESRFRSAIALDERSPAAWFGLGRALAHAKQADAALAAFARARTLGWSGALDLELGRLHLAGRRTSEARALLQPLAADPHGGSIAEQATALLKELDGAD